MTPPLVSYSGIPASTSALPSSPPSTAPLPVAQESDSEPTAAAISFFDDLEADERVLSDPIALRLRRNEQERSEYNNWDARHTSATPPRTKSAPPSTATSSIFSNPTVAAYMRSPAAYLPSFLQRVGYHGLNQPKASTNTSPSNPGAAQTRTQTQTEIEESRMAPLPSAQSPPPTRLPSSVHTTYSTPPATHSSFGNPSPLTPSTSVYKRHVGGGGEAGPSPLGARERDPHGRLAGGREAGSAVVTSAVDVTWGAVRSLRVRHVS